MKTKVLSIVQGFPENVVTRSKFEGFAEHPGYDYRVFCWKSDNRAWQHWAVDVPQSRRSKVMVASTAHLTSWRLGGEIGPFLSYLISNTRLCFRYMQRHVPLFGFWRSVHRLLEDYKILRFQPAILHFEFGTLAVGKMYIKDFLGCKAVVSFRGFDLNFYQLGNDAVYQPVWDNADACHFLGQDLWKRAQRRGFPDTKMFRFIPPAVDTEKFQPHPARPITPAMPVNLVSVCRLVWKKGLHFGLLAFSSFLKKGGKGFYHLVGDGPAREELLFYVHELGLTEWVVFHGKCSPQQVRELLADADIFLHPSVSEGFCNAALEAQAMQLPVICFKADGLEENVAHGESGYVVPLWHWQEMAQHLFHLWNHPEIRVQMGINGRKRMMQHFSPSRQIEAFHELYQAVLQAS